MFGVEPRFYWRIDDGDLETGEVEVTPLGIELEAGDEFGIEITPMYERLVDPFEIFDGITIPAGEYEFTQFSVFAEFATKRPLSGRFEYGIGSFFDGQRRELMGRITWRVNSQFRIIGEVEHNDIELPFGNFDTTLASLQFNFDFSPSLSWSLLGQWDDVSDSLGINSRVRWIIEPGNELFFVINQTLATADPSEDHDSNFRVRAISTDVTVKLSWTFRF